MKRHRDIDNYYPRRCARTQNLSLGKCQRQRKSEREGKRESGMLRQARDEIFFAWVLRRSIKAGLICTVYYRGMISMTRNIRPVNDGYGLIAARSWVSRARYWLICLDIRSEWCVSTCARCHARPDVADLQIQVIRHRLAGDGTTRQMTSRESPLLCRLPVKSLIIAPRDAMRRDADNG